MEWIQSFDSIILTGLRGFFCVPWLDKPMIFISRLGDHGLIWIALTILFFLVGNKNNPYRSGGTVLAFSLAINALLCNMLLKPMVGRMRPYDLMGYDILLPRLTDFSFPSGHTAASFASATAIYALNKKWGIGAYIFATLMGFSRLYLGVHFPSDVLAGAFTGWVAAKIAIYLYSRLTLSKKSRIS
ncbi:phosphatase PAP2 family protein [Anaerotignum propionicum]|uniref:phosphatase PAP2 family protein n=1 Tax=Anaerotignum propionicum TaxID=28446 RepID=UPI0028A22078|nr:phosphatase PAP2 family protein [Anaerotignum propionicum]